MNPLGKKVIEAEESGQIVDRDFIAGQLEQDLIRMSHVLHLVRTDPKLKEAMVELFYERSVAFNQAAEDAKKEKEASNELVE